jgi:mannitol/fructose-specific phosphotransferase system IIA component (Ntr-type)
VGVLGISERGVDFGAPDHLPVRLFVALLSPREGGGHLRALAAVGQAFSDAEVRERLLAAPSAESVHRLLAEARSGPLPPRSS